MRVVALILAGVISLLCPTYHVAALTPSASPVSSSGKETWMRSSLEYYSRLTRGITKQSSPSPSYVRAAMETYFAKEIMKQGNPNKAERIYRRMIQDSIKPTSSLSELFPQQVEDVDVSDMVPLAVPTLLLALHLQRDDRVTEARAVYDFFFQALDDTNGGHQPAQCSCTARVLQAYGLFEMKQGNSRKAYRLASAAVCLDSSLRPFVVGRQKRRMLHHEAAFQTH